MKGRTNPNQSDVDLLVDFEPGDTLFEQFYLQEELEALLNVHVDVIPRSGLKPRGNRIREEALAAALRAGSVFN